MHGMSATRRNVRLLGWFNFCNDFRIYGPVMVVYFAHVTGSYAEAVLILAIAKIASSLFELPTGVFSDFVGRRKTLLCGQMANILCIAAYGASSSFISGSDPSRQGRSPRSGGKGSYLARAAF